jgi:putative hydrolase of the HAD superfamily
MAQSTTFQALLLDFGGVIILPHVSPQRRRWLDRIGRENDEFETWMWHTPQALAAMRGEMTPEEFWTWVGEQVGLTVEQSTAMSREYWAGDELNQAAIDLARSAKAHGLRVGMLSNAYSDLRPYLAPFGILDVFDDVVISALVGMIKPDPAIYDLACSRLGVQPGRALFIDDNRANVESARRFGLRALRYVGEHTLAHAARRLGLPWSSTSRE